MLFIASIIINVKVLDWCYTGGAPGKAAVAHRASPRVQAGLCVCELTAVGATGPISAAPTPRPAASLYIARKPDSGANVTGAIRIRLHLDDTSGQAVVSECSPDDMRSADAEA
jgi:hypothetical protein